LRPYLEKNPSQKRAVEVAQGVGPEFKPQYCKKIKKEKEREREREREREEKQYLPPAWGAFSRPEART
jgi:hypothetical protein